MERDRRSRSALERLKETNEERRFDSSNLLLGLALVELAILYVQILQGSWNCRLPCLTVNSQHTIAQVRLTVKSYLCFAFFSFVRC